MGTLVPVPSRCQPEPRAQRAAPWPWVSGPASGAGGAPPFRGCGLAWSWSPGLFFISEQSSHPLGSSSGRGHLGQLCPPRLLPCPSPGSGMDTQPVLVIVCGASLQPPSRSAPPLACKVCFLIAAPTTHLVQFNPFEESGPSVPSPLASRSLSSLFSAPLLPTRVLGFLNQ